MRFDGTAELKAIETKSGAPDGGRFGAFRGVVSQATEDLAGDTLERGCFGNINPKRVALLRGHDGRTSIGRWLELRSVGDSLLGHGEIDLDDPTGASTYLQIKTGCLTGLSV